MLKTHAVQVSWQGTDISLAIDADAPFSQVTTELREYLEEKGSLFSRGEISVNAGSRLLSPGELGQIRDTIESYSGLKVTRYWCNPDSLEDGTFHLETRDASTGRSAPIAPKDPVQPELPMLDGTSLIERVVDGIKKGRGKTGDRSQNQSDALFIKATFRSGEVVQHSGDVVVLGDVNPGAEIQADGDIVVLGALKGLAHAGASHDTKAAIIALELDSPRIQIGPYESLASPTGSKNPNLTAAGLKIAYVRRRSIHVSLFAGRFARYIKGAPYDG